MDIQIFMPNNLIFKAGDQIDDIYILLEGEIE